MKNVDNNIKFTDEPPYIARDDDNVVFKIEYIENGETLLADFDNEDDVIFDDPE